MGAQHLPRDLVRPGNGWNNWLKRRISDHYPIYLTVSKVPFKKRYQTKIL